jgi:hypothetical protein
VLVADGYDDGELDWWSFDLGAPGSFAAGSSPAPAERRETLSFIPAHDL